MIVNEHYKRYQNMIRKYAWNKVRHNSNLEFDEMVAVGNLAYSEALQTWDESKGTFSTHLHWALRHRLGFTAGQKVDDIFFCRSINDVDADGIGLTDLIPDPEDYEQSCNFHLAVGNLSSEAREVVDLIFNSAGELCDFTTKVVKITLGNIRKNLRGKKWPANKVDKALAEVKGILQEI
jgi:hypothetical protein